MEDRDNKDHRIPFAAGPESEAGILDGVVAKETHIVCLLDYIGLVSVVECIYIHLDLNPNFRVYIPLKELLDGVE